MTFLIVVIIILGSATMLLHAYILFDSLRIFRDWKPPPMPEIPEPPDPYIYHEGRWMDPKLKEELDKLKL